MTEFNINVPKTYEVRHLEEQTQLGEQRRSFQSQSTQTKQPTERDFFISSPPSGISNAAGAAGAAGANNNRSSKKDSKDKDSKCNSLKITNWITKNSILFK